MGDSFRIERQPCGTSGCGTLLVFFTDSESVAIPGEQSRATCPLCGGLTVLPADGVDKQQVA